jgi:hypothetical protein
MSGLLWLDLPNLSDDFLKQVGTQVEGGSLRKGTKDLQHLRLGPLSPADRPEEDAKAAMDPVTQGLGSEASG